jgi:hypothetical protein
MTTRDALSIIFAAIAAAVFATVIIGLASTVQQNMANARKLDTALTQVQSSIELEKKRLGDAVMLLDAAESPGDSASIEIKIQFLLSRIEILIQLQKMSPTGKNGDVPVPTPAPKPVKPTGSPSPTGSASIGSTAVISTSD